MPPYHPYSQPANYPIFRQAIVIGAVLLLIFSGLWLMPDASNATNPDTEEREVFTIRELPSTTPPEAMTFATDEIEAEAALVYDVHTETVLFEKAGDAVHSLASITKLMTALVVTELLDELGEVITVSADAVAQYGNSGLRSGERISAGNLTNYALLSSSNDAAYALAYSLGEQVLPGEGSQVFVDLMNIRAEELGLSDTIFQNPTGLDISTVESGALGTAVDVTKLMQYILSEHPELLRPTSLSETRIYNHAGEFHRAANTNPLVHSIPNLLGSKTGYTDLAGGNLTIAYDAGFNRPVIITVLDSSWSGRFTDVQKLVDATQRHLQEDLQL